MDNQEDKDIKKSEEKQELTQEEQEKLKEQIKDLQDKLEEVVRKKMKRRRIIAIEFGSAFHNNPILNVLGYFMLNLTVIYGIIELFKFGSFSDLTTAVLFVLIYTVIESLFRIYILSTHFQLVLKSLGFIFFFGYLTIFYIVDIYLFPQTVTFLNETTFIVFVGMFVVFRYIFAQLIKTFIFGRSWH